MIRIIHSNGHVEEISGTITAGEVMKAYPKHVLKKPSSQSDHQERGDLISATKIVIVPPEAELQRGKIYFLVPAAKSDKRNAKAVKKRSQTRRHGEEGDDNSNGDKDKSYDKDVSLLISDRYLTEILSEKIATQKERRKGRVGVWRPHLESINED